MNSWLFIAILFAAAAALLWLVAERRRRVHAARADLFDALLGELSTSYIYWDPDDREIVSPRLEGVLGTAPAGFENLAGLLAETHQTKLQACTAALRKRGETFDLTVETDGAANEAKRTLGIQGRRSPTADIDILWITDISEQTNHEADMVARLESAEADRAELQAMMDRLPTAIWGRHGSNLDRSFQNDAFRQVFGDRPSAADAQLLDMLAAEAVRTGEPQTERRHIISDGERRYFKITLSPVEGIGVVGQAIDETRVEQLEAELERHIAAHSDVLETLAVAIAIYGPDTRLAFHNTAYARLWDSDPQWLTSNPTLGEELDQLRSRRRLPEQSDFKAWRDGEIDLFTSLMQPREGLMHLPDGRAIRNRVSPHPFGGLLFTYEDVTDRLALEAEYNTLIEVQRRSLDNLYEGIALIGGDGKLKLCNAAFKRLWNYTDDQVAGEPHISELIEIARPLVEREDVEWSKQLQRAVARVTSRTPQRELVQLNNDVVLQHATVPLPDGMVLLTFMDISDRLKVEQALRERAEALEAADELKTQFIANVSYELRTPLSSVIGFTEILKNGMVGSVNEAQADYLDSILQSSQELLDLINDILDLATIEAGYMELHREEIDIHAMLENVHMLVRERARNKQLSMTLDCPEDIGTMYADERRMKQVVFNLATNAINFTPPEGHIVLSATRKGKDVILTVSDSGIGIPEDQIARVFNKFERGSEPLVRQSNTGAGLGLSLVQSFVQLHGGEVAISSNAGQGTSVSCRIPATAPGLESMPTSGAA